MILERNVAVGVIDGDEESVLDAREEELIEEDVEFEYTAGIRGSRPEENQSVGVFEGADLSSSTYSTHGPASSH